MTTNGIEANIRGTSLKITGRDFLIIVILAIALGYIVWDIHVTRRSVLGIIEGLRDTIAHCKEK